MPRRRPMVCEFLCRNWEDVRKNLKKATNRLDVQAGEHLWFRGMPDRTLSLSPSLMRMTENLKRDDHDGVEQNLFFEFQAKAAELRARGLSDWEYLFYGRHYGVPTRVLDWTDTFGVALYFAVENVIGNLAMTVVNGSRNKPTFPTIWILNPYALNDWTWDVRDIILPKYLGLDPNTDEYRDFGEMLATEGDWYWDAPVAIYPAQIHDRVKAQRGWFTIHGQSRAPLEVQAP